jgi:flagellar biosynthesis/type III secretory pathway protein FliH
MDEWKPTARPLTTDALRRGAQDRRSGGVREGVEHGKEEDRQAPERPPGLFVHERLAVETAEFLVEVKRLARQRARQSTDPPPPPPRGTD